MPFGPVCANCEGKTFEMKEFTPKDSKFKLHSVQCQKCGVSIGVTEFLNIGASLEKLAKKLGVKL